MTDTLPDDLSPALGGNQADRSDAPALGGAARLAHLLEAVEDSDPAVRARAADALADMGGEAAITRLMALLLDPQADLRAQAARALGRARHSEAADLLIDALRDENERVRWNAAEALGRIGHEGAVRHLLAATQSSDQVMRERAAESLGYIGSMLPDGALREAIPPALLEMLRVTSPIFYPRLSQFVLLALVRLGDAPVVPLIEVLEQAQGRISESAAQVLGVICHNPIDPPLRELIVTALLRASAHREPFIARAAIRALEGAASTLVQGDDPRLARQVLAALVALHSALNQPSIIGSISIGVQGLMRGMQPPARTIGYVRPDLLRALGSIARQHVELVPQVLPVLIDTLYDDEPDIRRASIDAIGSIANDLPKAVHGAIPALSDRLHDHAGHVFTREPRISDTAAVILRRLATPEALDVLTKAGR